MALTLSLPRMLESRKALDPHLTVLIFDFTGCEAIPQSRTQLVSAALAKTRS
jgi:hypothetical protein